MTRSSQNIEDLRTWFESRFSDFVQNYYGNHRNHGNPENLGDLGETICWVLEGRGKRVRANLAMLTAEACGADPRQALLPAIAVELLHAASLIHDDLPCIDNDDLRRGRPTAHVRFGEARALLAGDALLVDPFWLLTATEAENLARAPFSLPPEQRASMVCELAAGGGGRGMVLGQALDMQWTGRGHIGSATELERIHSGKTGALIGAACAMGAVAARRSSSEVTKMREFGRLVGVAFQMIDDLLDDSSETGKSSGKDKSQNKLTWLAIESRAQVEKRAVQETKKAFDLIETLGNKAAELRRYTEGLLQRRF